MSRRDALAEGILTCKAATARYLAGFDDANHTSQAPNLPNHAAWSLGHCAMYMNRVAERLDGGPMPESDFIVGDMTKPPADPISPRGDKTRFHTESISFGSKPSADPAATHRSPAASRSSTTPATASPRPSAPPRMRPSTSPRAGGHPTCPCTSSASA